jgi:hypothetical protein
MIEEAMLLVYRMNCDFGPCCFRFRPLHLGVGGLCPSVRLPGR